MTYAVALSPITTVAPTALIVDAVRCWREARDRRHAVVPVLFARLEAQRAGFLAPAIDALLAMFEAWSGRRFRTADPAAPSLSEDEHQLLGFLRSCEVPSAAHVAQPGLTAPLHIALRSTRIIIRSVLGQNVAVSQVSAPTDALSLFEPSQAREGQRETGAMSA